MLYLPLDFSPFDCIYGVNLSLLRRGRRLHTCFAFNVTRVLDFALDTEILFFEEVLAVAVFLLETVRLLLETGLRRVDFATVTFFLVVFL